AYDVPRLLTATAIGPTGPDEVAAAAGGGSSAAAGTSPPTVIEATVEVATSAPATADARTRLRA
ncbi:hypothetical protein, partial [uncultured Nocardioides sp.]|uniref:hypothetical protein n=1 Tax=uncultured Nocardioides sp. TaxID=198441 RepID=UPI002639E37F